VSLYYLMDQVETVRRSFRDPAGSVVHSAGRVLRYVNATGASDFKAFQDSDTVKHFIREGKIVGTCCLESANGEGVTVLEHERIPFASYPYEWAPEMLSAAGLLTIDIAEALLGENMGLKDATPFNILWRGPNPVFVDVLSIERRDPLDATWLPLAQFQRTFVLPLMANALLSVPLNRTFLTSREGLEPEDLFRWAGSSMKWNRNYMTEVALPVWLNRRSHGAGSLYQKRRVESPDKARYILESLFRRQRNLLTRAKSTNGRSSAWSDYAESSTHYSNAQADAKKRFVEEVLRDFAPRRVLDIGCNTGHFSAMAARSGAAVVAVDSDPAVVSLAWQRARTDNLDILPLSGNIANPSPATGWRNGECPSFLERAAGAFDCVMMLAVVHHLLVTERVPLREVVQLVAQITTDLVILEFVGPKDPMFQRIARGRDDLHREDTSDAFEQSCQGVFDIVRSLVLPESQRSLYCLRKCRD
jgi:SAM-dependent methyltransferase